MKRVVLLFVVLLAFVLMSCNPDPNGEFKIGDRGPAGGKIFYDCDADNDSGNQDGLISSECGWRYLEVAKSDIEIDGEDTFIFGFHLNFNNETLYVNNSKSYTAGSSDANDGKSTGSAVGTGYANTLKLYSVMGNNACISYAAIPVTSNYAVKLCLDYECKGYDDWFLPSYDELLLVYQNLKTTNKARFGVIYWSSSESSSMPDRAYSYNFRDGQKGDLSRNSLVCIRPIRAF